MGKLLLKWEIYGLGEAPVVLAGVYCGMRSDAGYATIIPTMAMVIREWSRDGYFNSTTNNKLQQQQNWQARLQEWLNDYFMCEWMYGALDQAILTHHLQHMYYKMIFKKIIKTMNTYNVNDKVIKYSASPVQISTKAQMNFSSAVRGNAGKLGKMYFLNNVFHYRSPKTVWTQNDKIWHLFETRNSLIPKNHLFSSVFQVNVIIHRLSVAIAIAIIIKKKNSTY